MNLRQLSQTFRRIADDLDNLIGLKVIANETPEVAAKIRAAKPRTTSKKGYKYPQGAHWTQQPKNRARMLKMVRRSAKERMVKS